MTWYKQPIKTDTMAILSNNIKAILIPEDFTEMKRVAQEKCLTVQHFDYKCQRCRNEEGVPYGSTVSVILNCTIRTANSFQAYYDNLKSNNPYSYTFIFNAVFDQQKQLADYEDAMVVTGHIIDIEESFNSAKNAEEESEQMLCYIKILLSGITYVGKSSNKVLSIIK